MDEDNRTPEERRATYAEARRSMVLFGALTGAVVLLVGLAWTKTTATWPDAYLDRSQQVAGEAGYWRESLWAILLILMACQVMAVLLVVELMLRGGLQQALVWVLRIAVAVLAAGAFWWHLPDSWTALTYDAAVLELVVLVGALLVATRPLLRRPARPEPPAVAPFPEPTGTAPGLLAIGASGGGIRAASFVLGGHQAVQQQMAGLGITEQEPPPVYAVSGGSYVAAALALRRAFRRDGTERPDPTPWQETYDADSPELERLRRHTRYLFEPSWRTWDGMVSLLIGAALNLFLLAVALRFLTWVSAQVAGTTGLVRSVRNGDSILLLEFAPGWGREQWAWLFAVPAACLVVLLVSTLVAWKGAVSFARPDEPADPRRSAGLVLGSAPWRVGAIGVAVTWLVLALGIPAAVYGVTSLMLGNTPNQTAATVVDGVGFGVRSMCAEAMARDVVDTTNDVLDEAELNPGKERSRTAGACGFQVDVARTVPPGTTVTHLPPYDVDWARPGAGAAHASYPTTTGVDPAAEAAKEEVEKQARDLVGTHRVLGQVAAIGAALMFVVGLLRRGPAPEGAEAPGWKARLRRVVMTWLPIAIVAAIATYLVLLWSFRFLIRMDDDYLALTAGLSIAALAVGYLVDANATSMHAFYRARLSSAFAVGVDDEGRAAELPFEKVYRFSELPATEVPLHVVTTLNSQQANEAPARRGGFPMVFGPDHVRVHREGRRTSELPTLEYEEYAGPGQVSVMSVVGMSGAAISPLMGRYGAQMAPYRFLLALFNLRVGVWVRNPEHARTIRAGSAEAKQRGFARSFLWLSRKPGLAQVALEAGGSSSAERRWVYLSDGGHLDNTGLVECVRSGVLRGRGGRVLVLDASNDVAGSWQAVGDAISVIRADLGVSLQQRKDSHAPPWMRRYADAAGHFDVLVVKAVRVDPAEDGKDWNADLPPDVAAFQATHRDFPRASTIRQKFGDLEFEAYRQLGSTATTIALRHAGWLSRT
jgi:hypothetical protein